MSSQTGAQIIAKTLQDLGVSVIFGIVGIPVVEIAEEAIKLGIRFLAFRNEQAAGYAATAYGYLTGRPGVCLVVGGPGVLHAMAGVGNANSNCFPLLLLAGSSETHLVTQGAFQELDAVSLLTPHTKIAIRPPSLESVPDLIENAYRTSFYGRPGPAFVDLPADIIKGSSPSPEQLPPVPAPPLFGPNQETLDNVAQLLMNAKSPLIVIGKGAAYARAEGAIRALVEAWQIPFLPTPMGKGVVPDAHPRNVSAARSTALQHADFVLLLGARLNWILHMGAPPKWNPQATFVQVDIEPAEIGRNAGAAALGLVGDVGLVAEQLRRRLTNWSFNPGPDAPYATALAAAITRNEAKAAAAAAKVVPPTQPLTFHRAYAVIQTALHALSPPESSGIVYVAEGANTMDIARSVFPVAQPRHRLDAGTAATMGVGPAYAIAAHAAYNPPAAPATAPRKKIVAFEGDSALGFSGLEVETMQRAGMDVLLFVLNNGGVYRGEPGDRAAWEARAARHALRSTSLGFETRYELLADMCGGKGYVVRTEEELARATTEGFRETRVCVVNVLIEAGADGKLEFGWQAAGKGKAEAKL